MFHVGKWQNESVLVIHAAQAEALVKGQRVTGVSDTTTHRILGLKTFSILVGKVYQRVSTDDPYAEENLIEVERRIDRASTVLNKIHTQLNYLLELSLPGISIKLYVSEKPLLIPLNFSTPHANLGARLVGEYDLVVRKIETCKRLGLLNSQQRSRCYQQSRRVIRGVFSAPAQYKDLSITRDDILQKTPKADAAAQVLGAISEDILHQRKRAQYGPLTGQKRIRMALSSP